jgi:membrane protease subunit (stomatin/prohibitin family)
MPLMRRGPGLIGTAARAGVAAGVMGRVQRRQQQRWAEQDQDAYAQEGAYAQQAAPAQAAPAEPDYTAELEKLAKLRDEGVITDADFAAKKKQLLGI